MVFVCENNRYATYSDQAKRHTPGALSERVAAFGVESELVGGDRGVFDVIIDGERVFSKHSKSRFPDDGEIVGMLRERGH